MSGRREGSSSFQGGNVPSWGGEKGQEREDNQPLSDGGGLCVPCMEALSATQEEEEEEEREASPKPAANLGQ